MKSFFSRLVPSLVLVAGLLILVNLDLTPLAVVLLLISKWQIFLGAPKIWWSNLHNNALDLIMGGSAVALLAIFNLHLFTQLGIAAFYLLWLVVVKPLTGSLGVAIQALIAQFAGLTVIFLMGRLLPLVLILILAWLVAAVAADHFLVAHQEPARTVLITSWGLLVAELSWLLSRWLIVYSLFGGSVLLPQAPLVVTILSYSLGNMYLDHRQKRLGKRRLIEYLAVSTILFILIIIGTEWTTKL